VAREVRREREVLFAAELEEQVAARPEEHRGVLDHAAHDSKTVVAAVERSRGFVALHINRKQAPRRSRDVRCDRGDDVDGAREVERRREVPDHDGNAVHHGAVRGRAIQLDADHERVRIRLRQQRGDRATPGAQVDRGPARGEHRRGPSGQLLRLTSRYVHAGRDVQHQVAEHHASGDPRERFAIFASLHPRLELMRVGRIVQELTRFVVGRDASCGGEARRERCGQAGSGIL